MKPLSVGAPYPKSSPRIKLMGAQHHQTFVALMQHDVFANHLAKGTFIEEHCRKQTEVVEGVVVRVRPIESKLVALVG